MVLSWGGVQDDALIHLRYADFLHRVHFITYDGMHPSYGTSSLGYVSTLALLRSLTGSPLLSRGVSTLAHLCLFAAVTFGYLRSVRTASVRVQLLGLSLLLLLVVPSAVRWLDDGMETPIVMGLVGIVVWWTQAFPSAASSGHGVLPAHIARRSACFPADGAGHCRPIRLCHPLRCSRRFFRLSLVFARSPVCPRTQRSS